MAQMDFDIMFGAYEAIRWMSPDEVQTALSELESMEGGSQSKMMISMMLINLWAKQDGRGALEYSLASKNQMTKGMGVMSGLMAWAKNDSEGAWEWFDENRDTVKKSGMMGSSIGPLMYAALAQQDMGKAFARMGDLNRQEKKTAISMIGMRTVTDPARRDEFVRQLEALDDKKLQDEALQSMVTMWAYQDPQEAVAFIDSREWDEETQNTLRTQVAASWANLDAEAALTWRLENLGENEDRGDAVAQSFSHWMTRDSESAEAWLDKQPAELRTDTLYQQTATGLQWSNNYEDAMAWANRIEEQESRESTYRQIYNRWNGTDETEAQKWLEGLDAETREAVETESGPRATETIPLHEERLVPR
ncbi:MAG: hypothetical protein VCA35_14985 [Roseibacillus sp.]